jgi:hypothetical protein
MARSRACLKNRGQTPTSSLGRSWHWKHSCQLLMPSMRSKNLRGPPTAWSHRFNTWYHVPVVKLWNYVKKQNFTVSKLMVEQIILMHILRHNSKAWRMTAPDKVVVHYHQSQPLTVIHQKVSLLCTFTASWLVIMFQVVTLSISWPENSSFKTSRPNNLYWLVNCKEYQDIPRLCKLLHHDSCFSHQLRQRNGFLHSASPQVKTWRPYILIRSRSTIPDTWPIDDYPTVV